jgi:hypothetical protein
VPDDGIGVYACRDRIYTECLRRRDESIAVIRTSMLAALDARGAPAALRRGVEHVLGIDAILRPDIEWRRRDERHRFAFDAPRVIDALARMSPPDPDRFEGTDDEAELRVVHPGAVHELLVASALDSGTIRAHHMVVP